MLRDIHLWVSPNYYTRFASDSCCCDRSCSHRFCNIEEIIEQCTGLKMVVIWQPYVFEEADKYHVAVELKKWAQQVDLYHHPTLTVMVGSSEITKGKHPRVFPTNDDLKVTFAASMEDAKLEASELVEFERYLNVRET